MILLDTNIVSELLKPAPAARVEEWLAAQDSANVYLSAISEAELRYGAAVLPSGSRRERLVDAIESVIRDDFAERILPFDSKAARYYAWIAAERRRMGRPISQADCQIAAVARAHGAVLASRNVRDFEGCDVPVIDPWEAGV